MESLGAVLGWKFNHEPGIFTEDNELISWPKSLGVRPTQVEIDVYTTEYEIFLADVAYRANRNIAYRKSFLATQLENDAVWEWLEALHEAVFNNNNIDLAALDPKIRTAQTENPKPSR